MRRPRRGQPRKLGQSEPRVKLGDELTVDEARVLAAAANLLPGPPTASPRVRSTGQAARAKLLRAIEAAGTGEGSAGASLEETLQEGASG